MEYCKCCGQEIEDDEVIEPVRPSTKLFYERTESTSKGMVTRLDWYFDIDSMDYGVQCTLYPEVFKNMMIQLP